MPEHEGIPFALFAPYNEYVALVGDWNDWQPLEMERGDDGWWRASVPLDDGEHEYKFVVKSRSYFAEDEMVEIPDPRAARVTPDTYENSCVLVQGGKSVVTTYEWRHDDVPLPQNVDLVIYEMHIGDYRGGPGDEQAGRGTFRSVAEKLDHLAELGINAVELMPVTEFPGDQGWGYLPRSLFAVENSYGSPDDLCYLIDECHARGIRVILDGVYNHGEDSTPLAQIDYTYWYYRDNPDRPDVQWGPKFNYEFHDDKLDVWPAREYVRDGILYWIDHYHIDGIRFDATAIINNYDVLGWLRSEIRGYLGDIKPFFAIAEHVPEDPTVAGMQGPMDAAWHESFSKQLMCTILGKDAHGQQPFNVDNIARTLNPRQEGYQSPYNVINYIDNHDQDRILWQLGQAGILDDPAFRRMKMGATLLLTGPGIPMIWMGQEFGESHEKTLERQPIDWSLLQNERNADLQRTYQGLIALRKKAPALRSDTVEVFHVDHERAIIAFKRWTGEGNIIVIVANLKDQYGGQVEIGNWPGDGSWHEYTDNYDIDVQGGVLRDSLAESEVKVYITGMQD
ncbi:MAG TPA: alpha-amylase family glycosyl hydrolase [Aggregatilinea sp.]|uniref:alpha-amylase family glycosyl hydrolase n=1 Tax=Aggregatilinea sp. TaxID=2806333 RepID=UPI002B8649B4|nr:alpha-amylase family glycosyl hydrolase [Aggregatilinea sp.]HML21096.1 alpha-amylase family glycosyl hydrolase [Aggregatilinea sp.]